MRHDKTIERNQQELRVGTLADVAAGIGIKYSGDERGPRRTPRGASRSRTAVDFDLTREVGSLLEREDA